MLASTAWRGASGDLQGRTTAAFGTGQAFVVSGAEVDDSVAELGLSLEGRLATNIRASLGYAGEFGGASSANSIKARVVVGF